MNFTLIKYAVLVAAVFGSGFGTAWRWQGATIVQLELEQANEHIASQRAARAATERRVAEVSAATAAAQAAGQRRAAERGAADAAGSGLRRATADAVRAAGDDPAACLVRARALGVVFDECSAALVEMAGAAQGWYIEAVKQHDAAAGGVQR